MTDASKRTNQVITSNPVMSFKTQLKSFDHNALQAGPKNKAANSGETMYVDFGRTNFVINGEKINNTLIGAFKEGAQRNKSQILNYSSLYNSNINDTGKNTAKREIDTDHGRAFTDALLKDIDKALASEFDELWEKHCKESYTTDDQKTDSFKKKFEEFYNAGRKCIDSLPAKNNGNKNYRLLAKEVFTEMFKYAGAPIPTDAILEELVTNCNQAGYEAAISVHVLDISLFKCGLKGEYKDKVININCTDQNLTKVTLNMTIPVKEINNPEGNKVCELNSSLEFILKSNKSKDGENVTYENGKLSITVPKILRNYNIDSKNLFNVLKKYLQKICEKLGFKFKEEIKMKHNFSQTSDNQTSEKGHLDNVNVVIMSRPRSNTI